MIDYTCMYNLLHCSFYKGTWQKLGHGFSSQEESPVRFNTQQNFEVEGELGSNNSSDDLGLGQ